MHVDEEQRKKLLTVMSVILSLPVLAVAIWTILITILVSHADMMTLILLISGCVLGYAASLVVAKIITDMVHKFLSNVSGIADGSLSLENLNLPINQNNRRVNDIMQSVNEIAVSYAKVISSIEHATSELKDVTESFNGLFQEITES